MSSPIGHALSGLGVYAATQAPQKTTRRDLLWMGWLVFVAMVPDLDYVIPALWALRVSMDDGMRITHSVVGCMVFPCLTLLVLWRLNLSREARRLYSLQVCLAALSHIVMDTLVGVWPLPLLWPLSQQRFKLPFGLLPSAPSFRLDNVYLYRNLLIEIGAVVPFYAGISVMRFAKLEGWRRTLCVAGLWLCAAGFMAWACTLAR